MNMPDVSRRGVYYNLTISPFVYTAPNGDIFKFSSQKRLDIYTRKINERLSRLEQLFAKYPEIGGEYERITRIMFNEALYKRVYCEVEKNG